MRDWPVLARYSGESLRRVALPLGGIGTGTISLGGRGDLRDWEIMNRPAKGYAPDHSFWAVRVKAPKGRARAKALEGPIDAVHAEGPDGVRLSNHGLPRFRNCAFEAAYPLGQVHLDDPEMPIQVRTRAFNPLIPADSADSGIPIVFLRFDVTNVSVEPLDVAVSGSLKNFIGHDGYLGQSASNRNEYRETDDVRGVFMTTAGVPEDSEQFGTIALVTSNTRRVSHRLSWNQVDYGGVGWTMWELADELLPFWEQFRDNGQIWDVGRPVGDSPVASLCVDTRIAPGETHAFEFAVAWHFPNRRTWTPEPVTEILERRDQVEAYRRAHPESFGDVIVGNYYSTQFTDAWDVVQRTVPRLADLEARTVEFVGAVADSDLPPVVKEAALSNLNPLRTQTVFRTADGRFFGWEGCKDDRGSCHGMPVHVWNYEPAVSALFGDLARSARETEFLHAMDDDGIISGRISLPLDRATEYGLAVADGQMAAVVKVYRDWQLCGDDAWLMRLWPAVKRAVSFAWIPGGWDADGDGVMEGCQHNTLDTDYYGPHPQIQTQYLAALAAAARMAERAGDVEMSTKCRRLFASGSQWTDRELFNGDYYEQQIRPPGKDALIAHGLRPTERAQLGLVPSDLSAPDRQLGAGCLVDQLTGQYLAHLAGLGHILDRMHVRRTLQSIKRYNQRDAFYDHLCHSRTYVLNGESGLLMASYPRGNRPERPFIYFNEVMTGFEHTATVHMLFEGMTEEGLDCLARTRARYDGVARNPFNEAECGHHYARSMVSFAAVQALSGFRYSAVDECVYLEHDEPRRSVWTSGNAWGTFTVAADGHHGRTIGVEVRGGAIRLGSVSVGGRQFPVRAGVRLQRGDGVTLALRGDAYEPVADEPARSA